MNTTTVDQLFLDLQFLTLVTAGQTAKPVDTTVNGVSQEDNFWAAACREWGISDDEVTRS